MKVRKSVKAGSWYPRPKEKIIKAIKGWISQSKSSTLITSKNKVKAIIGPHAGFSCKFFHMKRVSNKK